MAEADPIAPKTFNVHEAKTHFSRLLDRAHAGEEIVVAKAGVPYAKLVAIDPPKKEPRPLGGLGYELPDSFFEPLTEEELAEWGMGR